LRIASGAIQESIHRCSLIAKKVANLTAMKVDIHPGPATDIIQLCGHAQKTLKSPCITGILEAETAYMMESVGKFIDATEDLAIQ